MNSGELRSRAMLLAGGVSWSTASQILSALSNFAITIAVVRSMGADGLGRFTIAFMAYISVMGFTRSLVSEPLLALPRKDIGEEARRASVTLTLMAAVSGAIVVGGLGLALDRIELVVVTAALPITLLQDLFRYQAFQRKQPRTAAFLDGGWLVGTLLAWPIVTRADSPSIALCCWAGAALVGLIPALGEVRPKLATPAAAISWWRREARRMAVPLLADSLLVVIGTQALVIVVTVLEGDDALGLLRAGQVYFAPLGIFFTAIGVFAVPHLSQRASATTARLALQLSGALAVLATVISGVIVLGEPHLHSILYADAVDVPLALLIPLALGVVNTASGGGLAVVSKVRQRAGDIARSRSYSTIIGLILVVGCTAAFGIEGTAWATLGQGVVYTTALGARVVRARIPAQQPLLMQPAGKP